MTIDMTFEAREKIFRAEEREAGRAEGLAEGRAEGIAEGIAEGTVKSRNSIIANMLSLNLSDENIIAYTSCTQAELDSIRSNMQIK